MTSKIISQVASESIIDLIRKFWHTFNKNYRETLKYLWALANKHQFVFPTYERMAEMCGYSLRTAINICKKLAKLGIIGWQRRGYRSNLYFLPDELIKFNLRNTRLLTDSPRQSCTISCTVLNNIDSDSYVHCEEPLATSPASPNVPKNLENEQQKQNTEFQKLPVALRLAFMKEFDFERGGWIIQNLSECSISEILSDMKWFSKQQKVTSYCGLFVKLALNSLGIGKKK
jgi:hypothetical protein